MPKNLSQIELKLVLFRLLRIIYGFVIVNILLILNKCLIAEIFILRHFTISIKNLSIYLSIYLSTIYLGQSTINLTFVMFLCFLFTFLIFADNQEKNR